MLSSRRRLLLLDEVSSGYKAGFAVFAAITFGCACIAIDMSLKRAHYKDNKIIKFLFPLALFILTYINLVMIFGDVIPHGGGIAASVFVLQPIVVPILMLLTFEITYILHKRRSVNFCGIQFDEGRRLKLNFKDWVLRNLVRIVSGGLIAIGIVANFAAVEEGDVGDESSAMSVGWVYAFSSDSSSGSSLAQNVRAFMSLIPVSILVVANFYFSFVMWLYGSNRSMIIHSSYVNPWISLLLGTVALAITQILGSERIYPLTSSLGYVIIVVSILVLMVEVDKDMQAADDFSDFLSGIAPHNVAGGGTPAKAKKAAVQQQAAGRDGKDLQTTTQIGGFGGSGRDIMTHQEMVAVGEMQVSL